MTTGAFGAFSAVSIYKGNEIFFDNILMPLVHTLNPETSHKVAIITSKYGFFPRSCYEDPLTLVRFSQVLPFNQLCKLVLKFLCDDNHILMSSLLCLYQSDFLSSTCFIINTSKKY